MKFKKFYKKAPLEAVQFDGSQEMMDELGIEYEDVIKVVQQPNGPVEVPGYSIQTVSGRMKFEQGDWIAKWDDGTYYPIENKDFQENYEVNPERTVFKFTAYDYISKMQEQLKDRITGELGENAWTVGVQRFVKTATNDMQEHFDKSDPDEIVDLVLEHSLDSTIDEFWKLCKGIIKMVVVSV
ncbi:hypothetical protein [Secundilactobacillus similis]|uniref:hypothetical protein n=1 Tax=Secundilactobacillus similis TaxID=414682 RepID=UPI0006D1D884|nr:hypothetical protein [Secundilactobacillus similis]